VHLRQRLAEEPTLKILGKPFDQAELVEVVRALLSFEPVSNVA
jgi:DNA-binding response OmpR family regulator